MSYYYYWKITKMWKYILFSNQFESDFKLAFWMENIAHIHMCFLWDFSLSIQFVSLTRKYRRRRKQFEASVEEDFVVFVFHLLYEGNCDWWNIIYFVCSLHFCVLSFVLFSWFFGLLLTPGMEVQRALCNRLHLSLLNVITISFSYNSPESWKCRDVNIISGTDFDAIVLYAKCQGIHSICRWFFVLFL